MKKILTSKDVELVEIRNGQSVFIPKGEQLEILANKEDRIITFKYKGYVFKELIVNKYHGLELIEDNEPTMERLVLNALEGANIQCMKVEKVVNDIVKIENEFMTIAIIKDYDVIRYGKDEKMIRIEKELRSPIGDIILQEVEYSVTLDGAIQEAISFIFKNGLKVWNKIKYKTVENTENIAYIQGTKTLKNGKLLINIMNLQELKFPITMDKIVEIYG